jgi:nucleoporin NDC1
MSTTTPNPSRHEAPIGAITSRLVGRSTLTLPPSDQSYEPLIKSLFRTRLRYMLLISASSTWFVISCWTWWQSGGVLRAGPWAAMVLLFGPLTLLNTAVNWAMVALPVIVLHKIFLTGKWLNHSLNLLFVIDYDVERRSSASSPITIVKSSLSLSSTKIAFATHLVSAIFALLTHVVMVYTYEIPAHGDPKLSMFVKSR